MAVLDTFKNVILKYIEPKNHRVPYKSKKFCYKKIWKKLIQIIFNFNSSFYENTNRVPMNFITWRTKIFINPLIYEVTHGSLKILMFSVKNMR